VVEGVGDHGLRVHAGGRVVVLGSTGPQFRRRHVGGIAYVYDPDGTFADRVNPTWWSSSLLDAEDRQWLADIVDRHHTETGSTVADATVASWGVP